MSVLWRLSSLLLMVCAFLTGSVPAATEEMHAVILNGISRGTLDKFPQFSLEKAYTIKEHRYWPAGERYLTDYRLGKIPLEEWKEQHKDVYRPLDDTFIENLKKSKLLYVGQQSAGVLRELFAEESYRENIKEFLKTGGTILFDYYAGHETATDFLKSVGVDIPQSKSIGSAVSWIWPEYREHFLFNVPHKVVDGPRIRAHGGFEKWSDKQMALLRSEDDRENESVFVIQENVLGSGRVMFNQAASIFRERMALTDNIIAYVYGLYTGSDKGKKKFVLFKCECCR